MIFRIQHFVIVVGSICGGCTSALAPENEVAGNSGQVAGTEETNADGKKASPANTAAPATGSTSPAATTSNETSASEGEALGVIATEVTDLDSFKGKSTYALSIPASGMLSISIHESDDRDTMFRKVKSYSCKPCQGSDDSHCQTGETVTSKYVSVNFMKSFVGDAAHKVNDQGFPKANANALVGNFTDDQLSGLILSNSLNPAAQGTKGTVTFSEGKRPAKTGDAYEATVDIEFGGGAHYKSKISGKVYEFPTNPTPPTCTASEYLDATYEAGT